MNTRRLNGVKMNRATFNAIGEVTKKNGGSSLEDVPPEDGLYIENLYTGASLMRIKFSDNAIEYSLDQRKWEKLPAGTETEGVPYKGRLYFRASGLTPTKSGIGSFTSVGNIPCAVGGNIMSMIYGRDFIRKTEIEQSYALVGLFSSIGSYLRDASGLRLPATTLAPYCYQNMFRKCTRLTTAPVELPATTLATYCYDNMFEECKALITAPALPATELIDFCYNNMFCDCTSLEIAPVLPATAFKGSSCYAYMFSGCSKLRYVEALFETYSSGQVTRWLEDVAAEGIFVKSKDATWDVVGYNGVPEGWTVEYK